jgi:hydroxyacylglutathione hydrolase
MVPDPEDRRPDLAIKEVHYWQYNVNYLILGNERAILFDTGPGVYSIRKVVERLTDLPMTVLASHLHFDHVGNHQEFDRIALPDKPDLRERTVDGRFTLDHVRHLYAVNVSFRVAEWWREGQVVDLGGRKLEVLSVPGHTEESTALLDDESTSCFRAITSTRSGPGRSSPATRSSRTSRQRTSWRPESTTGRWFGRPTAPNR